jgi:hypothetical protein
MAATGERQIGVLLAFSENILRNRSQLAKITRREALDAIGKLFRNFPQDLEVQGTSFAYFQDGRHRRTR